MTPLSPYLFFNGTCADAMRFYERTLGARIETMMTHAESPMAAQMPPGAANLVMHAALVGKGFTLMASDRCMPGVPFEGMKGFSLSLTYEGVDEAKKIFAMLSEDGQVSMPLEQTFWAKAFGMLTDKFGTPWMINVNS